MTRHKSRGFGYSREGGANRAFTVKEMALPAQQTEPKARGHAERKKRHVNGRREEAVLVCFAQDDE